MTGCTCQTIRSVRYIYRDDRARIATCTLRTLTERNRENYIIDNYLALVWMRLRSSEIKLTWLVAEKLRRCSGDSPTTIGLPFVEGSSDFTYLDDRIEC